MFPNLNKLVPPLVTLVTLKDTFNKKNSLKLGKVRLKTHKIY